MSTQSLRQLDERLKQMKISELLAMNQQAEQHQIKQESRAYNMAYLAITGFTLLSLVPNFSGASLADYFQIVLLMLIVIVSVYALFTGGVKSILGTAFGAAIVGIYHLIVIHILRGAIQPFSLFMGVINILFALQYIQRANRYQALEAFEVRMANQTLYQDIVKALSQTTPELSNNLIDLQHLTQKYTVWLRPTIVVLYLHREKRLFFDTSQSFEMTINGQDKGGDKVNVRARIVDKLRQCSISRHSWLRYIRFSG